MMRSLGVGRRIEISMLLFLLSFGCNEQKPSFGEKPFIESSDVEAQTSIDPSDPSQTNSKILPDSIKKEFLVTSQQDGHIDFRRANGYVDLFIEMGPATVQKEISFEQPARERQLDVYRQGTDQLEGGETFTQASSPQGPLDILVIIDNSGSMAEEQINLSTKLGKLIEFVADSDWRIAVETTDPADPCGQYLITKNDANPESAFASAVTRGTSGSGNERGILQAVNGLKCNGGNWLRTDSTLAILIVSDEDNCSDGLQCDQNAWKDASYLTSYLNTIRVAGTNARVYGLIWDPSAPVCQDALRPGTIYHDAIVATDGKLGPVCSSDYSATLSAVSENISTILEKNFTLRYPAVQGTEEIYLDGVRIYSGYRIQGNVLSFDVAPSVGSVVRINYQYQIAPPSKTFQLNSQGPYTGLGVYVDTREIADNEYTFDHISGVVEFYDYPVGSEIKIGYVSGEPTDMNFPVASFWDGNSNISVTVNGALTNDWSIFEGYLFLGQTPPDGAKIVVTMTQEGGPQYRYPLFAPESVWPMIEVRDLDTGAEVAARLEKGEIIFAEADYRDGRPIRVSYPDPRPDETAIDVGYPIIAPETMVLNTPEGPCTIPTLVVSGSVVDYGGCGVMTEDVLSLDFTYQNNSNLVFPVAKDWDKIKDLYQVIVKVNGIESSDYLQSTTDGLAVEFSSLPEGTVVEVFLTPKDS